MVTPASRPAERASRSVGKTGDAWRHLRTAVCAAALTAIAPASAAVADYAAPLTGVLRCNATVAGTATLVVELDPRIPIAVVDDEDRPASYSESHVRIRLAPEGPELTIGRASGRFLAVRTDGEVVSYGRCLPGLPA